MYLTSVVLWCLSINDDQGLGSWGTSSTRTISAGSSKFDTLGTLYNAGLANVPQLVFSIGYMTFNGLFTSIANTIEWDQLALSRKSLRVTKPEGQQRTSYFLQLPFRFAIPLTMASGFIHWLMSQTLFLVRVDVQDENGHLIQNESKSACGFSRLSFLILCLTFTALICFIVFVSVRKRKVSIPLASACSLVISAACHPGSDEFDPHLKPVQWGVIMERVKDGIEHCSLSSNTVEKPLPGKRYA
jgi:hypothetical protein